jgi:hypothetical protein
MGSEGEQKLGNPIFLPGIFLPPISPAEHSRGIAGMHPRDWTETSRPRSHPPRPSRAGGWQKDGGQKKWGIRFPLRIGHGDRLTRMRSAGFRVRLRDGVRTTGWAAAQGGGIPHCGTRPVRCAPLRGRGAVPPCGIHAAHRPRPAGRFKRAGIVTHASG